MRNRNEKRIGDGIGTRVAGEVGAAHATGVRAPLPLYLRLPALRFALPRPKLVAGVCN